MSYVDIDGSLYSRNRSYELTPQLASPYVSREEFSDAKKELEMMQKQKKELLEKIEHDKRERDERISAEELQSIMFPVEICDKRINELTYLVRNAQIVEKSKKISEDEIVDLLNDIPTEKNIASDAFSEASDICDVLPCEMFFIKGNEKIKAFIGDRTPFYAFVDNEYVGYNRLYLKGWILADDSGNLIEDISKAWDISRALRKNEYEKRVQSTMSKFPNAYAQWKDEENQQLLDLYSNQGKTLAEISEVLGRTKNGVSLQIKRLLQVGKLPVRRKEKDMDEYSINPISIASINPSEISDNQMPDILNIIEQMEEWFKYVKEYAAQRVLENGICYEGYEIKTYIKDTYKDRKKAMEIIQSNFPNLYNSCVLLKRPIYVKKILGEENYNSSISEFVQQSKSSVLVKSK